MTTFGINLLIILGFTFLSCSEFNDNPSAKRSEDSTHSGQTLRPLADRPEIRSELPEIDYFRYRITLDNGQCKGTEVDHGNGSVSYTPNPLCETRNLVLDFRLSTDEYKWSESELYQSHPSEDSQDFTLTQEQKEELSGIVADAALCHREVTSDMACPSIYMMPHMLINPDMEQEVRVGELQCDAANYLCDGKEDLLKSFISNLVDEF